MTFEELEVLRKKAKNNIIYGIIITIIVCILFVVIFKTTKFLFFVAFTGGVIIYFVSMPSRDDFKNAFKEMFVLKSLKEIFTDLVYEPNRGIDYSVIANTEMMKMGDRYTSNDYVCGKYKNINVMQSDVHIEEKHETTDSDGNRHENWVTIFKGRWMIFDFNKMFKANIQVCQKGFGNAKVKNWGNELKYKRVKMEDEAFNDIYKIYAQSEHEAFYILTPSLMEKFKRIDELVKGKLLFCFVNNKLHVGIQNNKDSFEHSIFKKMDEQKILDEISKEIKLITNFVDELDLDNDLFRREV